MWVESYVLEELGLTLDTLGKFVIVSQCSSQSESYGIRYQDRFLSINGISCINMSPSQVVTEIRKWDKDVYNIVDILNWD